VSKRARGGGNGHGRFVLCVGAETVGGNGVGSAAAVLANIWLDIVGWQGSWGSRPERVGDARQKKSTTVNQTGKKIDLENVYDVALGALGPRTAWALARWGRSGSVAVTVGEIKRWG
jgi:hypothetical protein